MSPHRSHGHAAHTPAGRSSDAESSATEAATPEGPSPEEALELLRGRIDGVRFPLETSGAQQARIAREEILEQLDDHILPRMRRRDAPLFVVVGGSTGAGKSTLVNSLARGEVALTGVRRPTTRTPVLVCHPADRSHFVGEHAASVTSDDSASVPVESAAVPQGVALLDTPDIDSVVDSNRELAARLIAVADLWLYVTTATRYADAVPWALLHDARERGATLAVALNRMPRAGGSDVRKHLGQLLAERGFGQLPLFAVPETTVEENMLPAEAVKNLRGWLAGLAGDERDALLRQALDGLLLGLRRRVPRLAKQLEGQRYAAAELRDEVEASYAAVVADVDETTRDGSLLRGEVLIRWQEFVETGDMVRSLQAQASRWRSRGHQRQGAATGSEELEAAIADALASAIRAGADDAAARAARRWRTHPAGDALLDSAGESLLEVSPELPERAADVARDWQGRVRQLMREEGATKRSVARIISVDLEGLALVLMVGLLGYASGDAAPDGASIVPRRLLRAVFGSDSLRTIAEKARADLRSRVGAVLNVEAERFTRMVDAADVPDDATVIRLYEATHFLEVAR